MTKPMSNRILALGIGIAVLACGGRADAEKTNIVNVTQSAPTIDGVVTGNEWAEANTAGDFSLLRVGGPSSEVIEWKALWDDTALYILVTSDRSTWTGTTSGGIDWNVDNINFNFDPNPDGEANEAGDDAALDGYQISLNQPPGFSSTAPMHTEARANQVWGGAWPTVGVMHSQNNSASGGVLELMIPWADLNVSSATGDIIHTNAPNAGDSWLFNIGRNDGVNLPIWNYHGGQSFAQRPYGVITFAAPPPPPPQDPVTGIISHDSGSGTLTLSWEGATGQVYSVRSQTDLNASGDPASWPFFDVYTNILATPPTNTVTFPLPPDQLRFFIIQH